MDRGGGQGLHVSCRSFSRWAELFGFSAPQKKQCGTSLALLTLIFAVVTALHAACSPRHALAHDQIPPVSHRNTMVSYATVALAAMCCTPTSGFMSMVASIPKPSSAPAVSAPAPPVFTKDFAKPMQMPEESIAGVAEVMRSGRLNRYSSASAETSQVAQLEEELVAFCNAGSGDGIRFALGVNSCSSAILIALLGVGVQAGNEVLSNAFTFTAVPSAILRIGAKPVLVECQDR